MHQIKVLWLALCGSGNTFNAYYKKSYACGEDNKENIKVQAVRVFRKQWIMWVRRQWPMPNTIHLDTIILLHDFPHLQVHKHIFLLALFIKQWPGEKLSESETVELIYRKFEEKPQRRKLQPREVENAVSSAFNSSFNNWLISKPLLFP